MPRVVHFELSADHPEDLARFYTEVFGWTVRKWPGPTDYWLVRTGPDTEPGIDGAIQRRSKRMLNTVNAVDVFSVDEAVQAVERAGGRVVVAKMAVPGVGYVAYCEDTEGNVFGMIQDDPSAK